MTATDESSGNPGPRGRGRPRAWDDKTEQNTIKSLDRAMELFEYLSDRSGMSLSTLAAETGQAPATVYRVLVTLEGRGMVEYDTANQLWHVGARAFVIGARFLRRTSLVERARPILRALMERTGETANLGIVQQASVLFVSQVETHASIRAFFPPGTLSPLHASGIGKALLAQMPEARLAPLLDAPRESFTPNTLVDAAVLRSDLEAIAARGYAVDDEERNIGMRCIAAPVFDAYGEAVAGLSVSGPTSRVSPDVTGALAKEVMSAAANLTDAIGGDPARLTT